VPTAQVIRRFRDLDMPVRDIGQILATTDLEARSSLIAGHLERLENQLDQTKAAVASLRRLLQPSPSPIEVEHRTVPATNVAAISDTVDHDQVLAWYDQAMAELEHTLASAGLKPTGPRGGLYDNELFTDERGDAVVYAPVVHAPTSGRVQPFVVPAGELAITVHHGPHDDIDISYGALGTYVTGHALVVAGPVRETYLMGPRDNDDSTTWRTEIGWPVFRTTAS
jgi:effector-binding domain-containing protein